MTEVWIAGMIRRHARIIVQSILFMAASALLVACFYASSAMSTMNISLPNDPQPWIRPKPPLQTRRILTSEPYKSSHCVVYHYWKASDEFYAGDHVTLVLHATPQYLAYLADHVALWDGGISVAIYIPAPRNATEGLQLELQSIFSYVNSLVDFRESGKISLHFFFDWPVKKKVCPELQLGHFDFVPDVADLADFNPPSELYPINPARNIARFGMGTELFISGDIEQIFSADFEPRMLRLGNRVLIEEHRQVVFVHRRFEIAKNASLPGNKAELAAMLADKSAVPFHSLFYGIGHNIAGLNAWLATPENFNETSVFRTLNYTNAEWEPQFVGDDRVPWHDDRFPFRLRSNTHVATLLCFQGFRFAVVNDLFTVHRGIKRADSAKDGSLKAISFKKGYKKMVKDFQAKLNATYPEMTGICPRFAA